MTDDRSPTPPPAIVRDVATCLQFFSRLPVPDRWIGPHRPDFATAVRVLPLAGLVIGACGALALAFGCLLDLPSSLNAILAIGAVVWATGGLHEDGLADMADGLGGGVTPERKLAIMRDSRIGSYGVLALGLALVFRIACLCALLDQRGGEAAATILLAAASVSRALALLPLMVLPPARTEGLGRSVGRPSRRTAMVCALLALLLGIVLPALAGSGAHGVLGCLLAFAASRFVASLARRQIGGHTGDIAGASQQAAEIAFLAGVLAFPP